MIMSYPIDGKPVNKEELAKQVMAYIAMLEKKVIAMQLIIPLLREFEGKKVTKIICNRAIELMSEFDITYKMGVVNYELIIYGNGIKWDDRITIWLCRIDSDKVLRESNWYEYPNWFDYAGHIDKLKWFLDSIHCYVTEWNKMINYLNEQNEFFHDMPYPTSEVFSMRKLIR